jgi:hypothetical protein
MNRPLDSGRLTSFHENYAAAELFRLARLVLQRIYMAVALQRRIPAIAGNNEHANRV